MNNLKLITTADYLLLVDSDQHPTENNERVWDESTKQILIYRYRWNEKDYFKILGHRPLHDKAPLLDGVDLLPEHSKSPEDLAKEATFRYLAASQKKYTEEDMENAIKFAWTCGLDKKDLKTARYYLESLSPTQEWEFEPEWDYDLGIPIDEPEHRFNFRLKTIPNPEAGKPNIVKGKWIRK